MTLSTLFPVCFALSRKLAKKEKVGENRPCWLNDNNEWLLYGKNQTCHAVCNAVPVPVLANCPPAGIKSGTFWGPAQISELIRSSRRQNHRRQRSVADHTRKKNVVVLGQKRLTALFAHGSLSRHFTSAPFFYSLSLSLFPALSSDAAPCPSSLRVRRRRRCGRPAVRADQGLRGEPRGDRRRRHHNAKASGDTHRLTHTHTHTHTHTRIHTRTTHTHAHTCTYT